MHARPTYEVTAWFFATPAINALARLLLKGTSCLRYRHYARQGGGAAIQKNIHWVIQVTVQSGVRHHKSHTLILKKLCILVGQSLDDLPQACLASFRLADSRVFGMKHWGCHRLSVQSSMLSQEHLPARLHGVFNVHQTEQPSQTPGAQPRGNHLCQEKACKGKSKAPHTPFCSLWQSNFAGSIISVRYKEIFQSCMFAGCP